MSEIYICSLSIRATSLEIPVSFFTQRVRRGKVLIALMGKMKTLKKVFMKQKKVTRAQ